MHEALDDIDIKGNTVSIDAMGCQKSITKKIISKRGNYFLALKANHPELSQDVKLLFSKPPENTDIYATNDAGHGRVEQRTAQVINIPKVLRELHPDWCELNSIVKVTSQRYTKNKETIKERYYITNLNTSAKQALTFARQHWHIENKLHWMLDVHFGEDKSLLWKNDAAENMAAIRKLVINMLKTYKKNNGLKKLSMC